MSTCTDISVCGMICPSSGLEQLTILENAMAEHKKDNVMLGGLVPPFYKAVVIVTVSALTQKGVKIDQLSLLLNGACRIAQELGILDADGKVTPQWKEAVELAELAIRENHKKNRGGKPGRRACK